MKRWRRRKLFDKSYVERITGEAKLCPECNLRHLAVRLPRRRSYTRQPTEKSTLRVCSELRAIAKKLGEAECKFYKGECLNGFLKPKRRK